MIEYTCGQCGATVGSIRPKDRLCSRCRRLKESAEEFVRRANTEADHVRIKMTRQDWNELNEKRIEVEVLKKVVEDMKGTCYKESTVKDRLEKARERYEELAAKAGEVFGGK